MYERLSRFDTRPGDIKVPASTFYPSKPVQLQSRWLVRMVATVDSTEWPIEQRVWAVSSTDAVARAEGELYAGLHAAARASMPVRVSAITQKALRRRPTLRRTSTQPSRRPANRTTPSA